jgi:hypothetical protein
MTDFTAIAAGYLAAWNETDAASRAAQIGKVFTPDATYVDPLFDAGGTQAIDATIAAAQARFPGWRFRLVGPVDGHHRQARFTWEFGPPGVEAPVVGFDVVALADDDRVSTVYGFLDKVPTHG